MTRDVCAVTNFLEDMPLRSFLSQLDKSKCVSTGTGTGSGSGSGGGTWSGGAGKGVGVGVVLFLSSLRGRRHSGV
jgi:hypothetical protein